MNNCNLDQTETAMDRWELFKHRVKDFSISYAKTYNRNIKKRIQYIEKSISDIEESPSSEFDMNV